MYRYRIYTEAKNLPELKKVVGKRFIGFTLYAAEGFYCGLEEAAAVIEILAPIPCGEEVEKLCLEIKALNAQNSVLVTEEEVYAQSL